MSTLLARVAVADDGLRDLGAGARARPRRRRARSSALRAMATVSGGTSTGCAPGSLRTGPELDDRGAAVAGAHRRGDGVGGGGQAGLVERVAVGVVGALAGQQAHGGADLAAAARLLDAAVLEAQAEAVAVLHVDLGEVAAAAQRARDGRLQQRRVEALRCPSGASARARRGRAPASASSSAARRVGRRPARARAPSAETELDGGRRGAALRRRHQTTPATATPRRPRGDGAQPSLASSSAAKASPRQVRRSNSRRPTAGSRPGDGGDAAAVRRDHRDGAVASCTTTWSRPASPSAAARAAGRSQSRATPRRHRRPRPRARRPSEVAARVEHGDAPDVGGDVEQIADGLVDGH